MIKQILKYLYGKPLSYNINCLPYRKYTFETKLKNIKDSFIYETNYILSLSFDSYFENLKYITFNNKQYSTKEIEWRKLLKTTCYYAYIWDTVTDRFRCLKYHYLGDLIQRQNKHIKYAKYISSKRLKKIITEAKHYYV